MLWPNTIHTTNQIISTAEWMSQQTNANLSKLNQPDTQFWQKYELKERHLGFLLRYPLGYPMDFLYDFCRPPVYSLWFPLPTPLRSTWKSPVLFFLRYHICPILPSHNIFRCPKSLLKVFGCFNIANSW